MRSVRWLGLLLLYVGAQLVGLALANPFRAEGLSSSANPQSPTAPLLLIFVVVLAPVVILLFVRRPSGPTVVRQAILLGISGSLYVTLFAAVAVVLPQTILLPPPGAGIAYAPALTIAGAASALAYLALLVEPQWYVVDLVGFVAAGSLVAILGISLGILPAFILLAVLMVYDAIAVYRTKHMVALADTVTEMKLPILMVMPESGGYDYPRARTLAAQREQPTEERAAMFMGLGDIVIPGTLVASAFVWLPSVSGPLGFGVNLWVALGALLGSLVGYAVLMRYVLRGNPQAGLPLLNGGALAGYAIAYLLLLHSFTLGLTAGL